MRRLLELAAWGLGYWVLIALAHGPVTLPEIGVFFAAGTCMVFFGRAWFRD